MPDASPLFPESMRQAPRASITAGTFFPAGAKALADVVDHFYKQPVGPDEELHNDTLLVMVPHAGYVYSGPTAAKTLRQTILPRRIVLLGPCHQHRGAGLSLWPGESWLTPLGEAKVDMEFYRLLVNSGAGFSFAAAAHQREHSLEVILPFLQARRKDILISPVAVSLSEPAALARAGEALAAAMRAAEAADGELPLIIVSSDMSHYLPQDDTVKRDSLALSAISLEDPVALYRTVAENDITMCGVLPMTLGLFAAKALGATKVKLLNYATSGAASGDLSRVVGYAGVLVY